MSIQKKSNHTWDQETTLINTTTKMAFTRVGVVTGANKGIGYAIGKT